MRIRTKPWARPELHACSFFVEQPETWQGKWRQHFSVNTQPLHLELGCGKGVFTAELAIQHPHINYLAVDISMDILGVARRNIVNVYQQTPVRNLLLSCFNIEYIQQILNAEDQVDRLYIYFPNPWSRPRHKKRRLTHPRQLEQYKTFLAPDAQIYFKTDDQGLFEESIGYLEQTGFCIDVVERDLHHSGYFDGLMSEHERMFSQEGIPIKFLIAHLPNPMAQGQLEDKGGSELC